MNPKLKYPLPTDINRHTILVEQTARWFHIGSPPSESSKILIALHGYGQHPAYMLDGLKPLLKDDLCILAPEGLSRFYIKGTDGRVGASWMTRDERFTDINDHINYLNTWWTGLMVAEGAEVIVLGFSQGVATAARWLAAGFPASKVILHSGTVPPEWEDSHPEFHPRISKWISIRGKDDPIYSQNSHKAAATLFDLLSLNFETLLVEGSHKMNPDDIEPHL